MALTVSASSVLRGAKTSISRPPAKTTANGGQKSPLISISGTKPPAVVIVVDQMRFDRARLVRWSPWSHKPANRPAWSETNRAALNPDRRR